MKLINSPEFGNFIKKNRKETQKIFARCLRVNEHTVGDWEKGSEPKNEIIVKILLKLGISNISGLNLVKNKETEEAINWCLKNNITSDDWFSQYVKYLQSELEKSNLLRENTNKINNNLKENIEKLESNISIMEKQIKDKDDKLIKWKAKEDVIKWFNLVAMTSSILMFNFGDQFVKKFQSFSYVWATLLILILGFAIGTLVLNTLYNFRIYDLIEKLSIKLAKLIIR